MEPAVNVLAALENGLFALGQVLRFPVFALLWVCVAVSVFMAGSCAVDAVARRRERHGFQVTRWLKEGRVLGAPPTRIRQLPTALRQLLARIEEARAAGTLGNGGLAHLLMQQEERARRRLSAARTMVRVGPSLGLLGTLIPMGSSLASMATGNLEAMAGQMVVAFTSTIIGLATGTIAYVVAAVRHNWVNETVRDERFLAERVAAELEDEELQANVRAAAVSEVDADLQVGMRGE
jgi:biopolymer transport protein ExbB/TolQ